MQSNNLRDKNFFTWRRIREVGLTADLADELGLIRAEGVIIVLVQPDSVAEEAGLRQGDVITEINRQRVVNLSGYNSALAKTDKGKSLLFHVIRGAGSLFLAMKR